MLQDSRRRMMQEPPERLPTEPIIRLRVENELVPEIVRRLRGHRNRPVSAAMISAEELLQAETDPIDLSGCQVWMMPLDFGDEPRRPDVSVDEPEPAAVSDDTKRQKGNEKSEYE
jgi:hypothetical protein